MKRTISFAFIAAIVFLSAAFMLSGCNKAAKETGVSTAGTNKGTITGHVYDDSTYQYSTDSISKILQNNKSIAKLLSSRKLSSKSISKSKLNALSRSLSRIAPFSSKISSYSGVSEATIMVGSLVATTDANGVYTISGIPSGTVTITTFKDGYQTTTLVANSDTVNFVLQPQSEYGIPQGSATITGTIEGFPEGVSQSPDDDMDISASSISKYSDVSSYDPDSYIYNISNAPDDEKTYVIAQYYPEDNWDQYMYAAYKRIDTSDGGIKTLNLSFLSPTSIISGYVDVPSGFWPYFIDVMLYDQNKNYAGDLLSDDFGGYNDYYISVPSLLSGDTYGLWAVAVDEGETSYVSKFKYDFTGTSYDFDLSSLKVPSIKSPSPEDGASLEGELPTFSWNSTGNGIIYYIYVYESDDPWRNIWECYTKNTSVTFPSNIIGSGTLASGVEYNWHVSAHTYDGYDISDMTSLKSAKVKTSCGVFSRSFTF